MLNCLTNAFVRMFQAGTFKTFSDLQVVQLDDFESLRNIHKNQNKLNLQKNDADLDRWPHQLSMIF